MFYAEIALLVKVSAFRCQGGLFKTHHWNNISFNIIYFTIYNKTVGHLNMSHAERALLVNASAFRCQGGWLRPTNEPICFQSYTGCTT